jgi:diguanylate cyclase (GGDEF)-like protein
MEDKDISRGKRSINFGQFTEVYNYLSQCSDDYFYLMDFEDDYYAISESATRTFALKESTFYNAGAVVKNITYPDDYAALEKELGELTSGKKTKHDMEYRWLDQYGKPVWISCRGVVINEDGRPRYMVGRIAEIGKQNRIDRVTGLYQSDVLKNRAAFFNEIAGYPAALMIIGIDNFKYINEWHGSEVGDQVLDRTARVVEAVIKDRGQVYRLDGDNIAVFSVDAQVATDKHLLNSFYKDIRSGIDKMLEESDYQMFYTISAGGVHYHTDDVDINEAISRAKFALHCAKNKGKNNYMEYSRHEYDRHIHKLEMQEEIRKAIKNDYEGFELYYQPIVAPAKGGLYGAEALLRWNSEKYGLVSPGELVPILEESGLIIPLGKWITETAANQCMKWKDTIPDFCMNINLSFVQLLKSDAVKDTMSRIDKVGVSHGNIVFEVTESGELETTRNVLSSFADESFRLAIDDFGTGYSNLRYVKEMMFDLIKIDRCFITNIHESEYNLKLVKHVTELAHSLNLRVCMEGVETEDELKTVLTLAPDCIQGYYYDKPLKANQFEKKYLSA